MIRALAGARDITYRCGMHSAAGDPSDATGEAPTAEISTRGYPNPATTVNLRDAITFRAVDQAGRPVLIISDGVRSVALESGPAGVSFGLILAARHLAEALDDFAASTTAGWQASDPGRAEPDPRGRHRRNRSRLSIPPLLRKGNTRDS